MTKMIITKSAGVTFQIDTEHQHSIDYIDGKPFWEYAFTPYAALTNSLFIQRHNDTAKIGTHETPALQFIRRELRIQLLQRIHNGHELSGNLFMMVAAGGVRSNSATIFDVNTLSWQMSSDKNSNDIDPIPCRDFPSFLEKIYILNREEAWLFAWVLVRAAYTQNWSLVNYAISNARLIRTSKKQEKESVKEAFINTLEPYVLALKNEVHL